MTCWNSDPDDVTDICNATVGQLWAYLAEAHPVALGLVQVAFVASVVLALGAVAAVLLVSWRRRMLARHEQEEVRPVVLPPRTARARGSRPVYPVHCTASETVLLRRRPGGSFEVDDDALRPRDH